ncbi:MAG: serine/threonine-protein kinase [bacterium]
MDLIANKYRVLKKLGQGAMGEVYLVLPPQGEPVALKLLKSLESEQNDLAIEQFENEFKILKRLSHPNIGRIFDYGFDVHLKKVFFTLPWLKGQELYEATEEQSYETIEEFFVQTLRALNYLHQKNLTHCDLKPGNIYIEDGQVIIIDFGLTGYWGENIVGTPTYLAPEIFHGTKHTIASDLYAVGVIFYNCLTRSQPFSGKDLQEVYDRHRCFTPPLISELNPKVPKYISDIIATLLNKKPEERYPTAAAVIEEIDGYSDKSYSVETEQTLLSYLPTDSEIIGKEEAIIDAQTALKDFKSSHVKEIYHLILIHGQKNVGKNRLIAKIRNELQLAKVSVETVTTPLTEQQKLVLNTTSSIIIENVDTYFLTANEMMHFKQVTDMLEQKVLSTTEARQLIIASSCDEKKFNTITKLFPSEETKITNIHLTPYTKQETEEFLRRVIGQDKIPDKFVEQFHHNSEGLPGVALDIIQSMIGDGLLFDKSGRWNDDLLSNLETTFDCIEVSETLEQEFERLFNSLNGPEEDITSWLSLCPHPLSYENLEKLTKLSSLDVILKGLQEKKIIRENNGQYTLYRSVFQNFVQANLPDPEVKKRHSLLAHPNTKLSKKWAIYHLSFSNNEELKHKAGIKLAQIYENEGERDKAAQTYIRLINNNKDKPLKERLGWYIKASELYIWLNHFQETCDLITGIEQEVQRTKPQLDAEKFLILLEKKGLAILHQYQLDKAKTYFEAGLKHAIKSTVFLVQKLRFENDLAGIESMLGNREKAIETFKKTREEAKKLTDAEQAKITNNDLGHVYLSMLEYEKAKTYLLEDIEILTKLINREPLARALYSYAEVLRAQQDYEACIEAYEKCISLCRLGNNHPLLLRAYNGLGNAYLAQENNQSAITNYQKAIDIAVRLREMTSKAALLYNQGIIYRKENNKALAGRRFMMAKQVLENKENELLAYDESLLSRCYNELSLLAVEEQNSIKALGYQLERMKLVDGSQNLSEEKFGVKTNLANLYLENRIEDQFKQEIKELELMAKSDDEKDTITKLTKQWKAIETNNTSEITGKIEMNFK